MPRTLALDVYGTLIDPFGVVQELQKIAGDRAASFAAMWRTKQLEYLFRRGLGRDYRPFSVCTRQALDFTAQTLRIPLTSADEQALIDRYLELPAFPEVPMALEGLRSAGWRCWAFSNGEPGDLEVLLSHAGLRGFLEGVVSVHEVASFKPDPAVYELFLRDSASCADETWLVSGNPFDILGAHAAGWHTAWIRRDAKAVFDPWGVEPTVTVKGMDELQAAIG